MSAVRPHSWCGRQVLAAVAGVVAVSIGIGTVSVPVSGASGAADIDDVSSIPTPLSTSIQSSSGTWATLPMGHLGQPLNTFWQLFFQPADTTSWTNKVGATATATNGGLVLATAVGRPLIAGIRPANLLHFSPLISTADGGGSWASGVLPKGLSARPDALSTATNGRTLALVNSGTAAQVLVSAASLSRWQTLTTARDLAATRSGRACDLRSLSAVAATPGQSVVGGDCTRPGVVGIFDEQAGTWRLDGPTLAGSLRHRRVQVLTVDQTATGLAALLGVSVRSGTALVAAWSTGETWTVSPTLMLARAGRLASFGPASGTGFFVLSTTSPKATRLAAIDGPGANWTQLPSPPRHTATVAFAPTSPSTIDALTDGVSAMTVWSLQSGSPDWVRSQVLHVGLKFGSSS
jgi:hypothetical protein